LKTRGRCFPKTISFFFSRVLLTGPILSFLPCHSSLIVEQKKKKAEESVLAGSPEVKKKKTRVRD